MAVMADSKHGRYHFLVFSTLCCIIAIGPPPDPLTAWADRVDIAAVLFSFRQTAPASCRVVSLMTLIWER
jgi:hypothetical protein